MSTPKVAVVGIGWWAQGWHLPHLNANPDVELIAIVDRSPHPQSKLNPDLQPLSILAEKYNCKTYSSLDELLSRHAEELQGIVLATPHATHYELGRQVLEKAPKIHILMEKPMTTVASEARKLVEAVQKNSQATFLVNHSANYREQTKQAHDVVHSGQIGTVKHVSAFFASPLKWIFEEPSHTGWNQPTEGMIGNGFSWGQSTHLIGWIYHVCSDLVPNQVSCNMVHSEKTGADVAMAATISCQGGAVLSLSGTSLLPGHAHSHPPVGKRVRIEIYGDKGALCFNGIDTDVTSGKLTVIDLDGKEHVLNNRFEFENLDTSGSGPESLQSWIQACQGRNDFYIGADGELGLKTVETVAAMYESDSKKIPINIVDCRIE